MNGLLAIVVGEPLQEDDHVTEEARRNQIHIEKGNEKKQKNKTDRLLFS